MYAYLNFICFAFITCLFTYFSALIQFTYRSHSFTISCILHEIADSCGIPAENVAIELKQRTNTLLIYCDIEDIPRLRTGYIEFLQGSTEAHILKRILHTDESFDETA